MTVFRAPSRLALRPARWARQLGLCALTAALLAGVGLAAAQTQARVVEVQAGDTFSGIAARYTGNPARWRQLYRAKLSGLSNPNHIHAGMRLELAADAKGKRYLRLLPPGQAEAATASAPVPSRRTAAATPAEAPRAAVATPTPTPSPSPSPALSPAPSPSPSQSPMAGTAGAGNTLVIGVLPNLPAPVLNTNYARMKHYLERGNQHAVTIVVPRNFKEFFDSTMRGDYDLAIAAPHFARVAQLDRSMTPLLTYQPQIHGLFITAGESTLKGPRDVRERAVAFANPQSLVAMYGRQWLKQAGLEPGTDYEARGTRTDLGVGRMLLSGDVMAAIMSNGEFRALPPDELSRLKVVEVFAKIPNFIFMAHPRIERVRLGRLKTQLQDFFADAEEGVPFAQATGFTGLVNVEPETMRELDGFTDATRRAMAVGP